MSPNRVFALLLTAILGGGAIPAWGQTTLSPSLTIGEEFDDNIFLESTNPRSDFITTVSPGVRLTVQETLWTVTLAGSARATYYASHPELNTTIGNRQGSLAVEFRPSPRLTVSLTDTLVRDFDPGKVDSETAITRGRFASTRNTATPVVTYQIDPLTQIRLQYAFTIIRSDSTLVEESDTHEGNVHLRRQFTPRASGTLRYTLSHFRPEQGPSREAHLPRLGFVYDVSPTSQISADAGPLLLETADGSTEISVGGGVQYAQQFSRGSVSIAYERSAQVSGAIGEGTSSQRVTALATVAVTRALTAVLEGAARETEGIDTPEEFRVYTAGVRLTYQILQWLAANVSYHYLRQDDRAGPEDLDRNIVFVGFTASTDVRVY